MPPTSVNQAQTRNAPIWRRFAALGYDSLILMALSMGYGALITSLNVVFGAKGQDYQPMLNNPIYFIGWIGVLVGFFLHSWCISGQTIGMRTWRIRLIPVDTTIKMVSLRQAALRCILGSAGLVFFGAGYWYRWFDTEGNTWHDKMTGTRVVMEPK